MLTPNQEEKNKLFKDITSEISDTLVKKNNDYGDSFKEMFDEFGMDYAVAHMKEKINRVKQLSHSEAMVKESLEDSLMDLAGYAVLTLATIKSCCCKKECKKTDTFCCSCKQQEPYSVKIPKFDYTATDNVEGEKKCEPIPSKTYTRQDCNRRLIEIMKDMIEKFPDARFGQMLYALSAIVDGTDAFSEEPINMLNRVERSYKRIAMHIYRDEKKEKKPKEKKGITKTALKEKAIQAMVDNHASKDYEYGFFDGGSYVINELY